MTDWQENTKETRKLFALAEVHKIGVIWLVYLYFLDHNLENIMILHFPYLFWWSNCSNESSWWYLRRSRTKWKKVSLLSSFCGLLWAWAWVSASLCGTGVSRPDCGLGECYNHIFIPAPPLGSHWALPPLNEDPPLLHYVSAAAMQFPILDLLLVKGK